MTVIETIQIRKSCRSYGSRAIEPKKVAELKQFLTANSNTPFGGAVRFELVDFNELEIGEIKSLTTYGVIKGARQFIIGTVVKSPRAMEDYGYCMERNILKATSMGLGTCILGGTFNRGGFSRKIDVGENEWLPVISPVGYAADRRSMIDRMFRWVGASDQRKPWNELFFHQDMNTALPKENSGSFEKPLECVRLAPSASNKQPWRILKDKNKFHFYLKRTMGYEGLVKDIRLQNIDMGIAMCHFELAAREIGLQGAWNIGNPQIKSGSLEYIVSWISRDPV